MSRNDITPEEKAKLADFDTLRDEIQQHGWPFRGRRLQRVSLAGFELEGGKVHDTDFESVDISGAKFTGTRFEDVNFRGCDLSGSRFRNVDFVDCTFEDVEQHGGYYQRSRFDDVRMANLKYKAMTFTGCQLKGIKDSRSYFEDTNFIDSHFQKSDLRETEFVGGRFDKSSFSDTSLDRARFSEICGTGLNFEQGELKSTGFDTIKDLEALSFTGCDLNQPSFSNVTVPGLRIVRCNPVVYLALRRSHLDDLVIEDCESVSNLRLQGTRLKNFRLLGGNFELLEIRECEIEDKSSFTNCIFEGSSLADSTIVELKIEHCRFEKFIVLEGTHFKFLRMTGVAFGPGFEVDSAGVVYESSDRFPS